MPKIQINQAHNHNKEDIEKRVEGYLLRMRDEKLKAMGFDYTWSGDKQSADFKGSGFTGKIELLPNEVKLRVDLNLMLSPFKSQVEESMKRNLAKSLA